jgi:excisionase family DNA binding protein
MDGHRLLSMHEAASYVGLSYKHFSENYRSWHIPHIRIGRKVMFRPAHLDAFLKRHTEVS